MRSTRFYLVSFFCGLTFAAGLGLSGMTRPAKVLAFLDIGGAWDPTLLLVMAGAIAVHMGFALRAKRAMKPVWAPRFSLPAREAIDARLFGGAALFGVGWGLQGYCPGPAVVASASGHLVPLVFVASMIAGLLAPGFVRSLRGGASARASAPNAAARADLRSFGGTAAPAVGPHGRGGASETIGGAL